MKQEKGDRIDKSKSVILVFSATLSFIMGYLVSSALRPETSDPTPVPQADSSFLDVPIWEEGLHKMVGRWKSIDDAGVTILEADFHLLTIPSSQHWEELSGLTFYLGYPNHFICGDFIYRLVVRSNDFQGKLAPDAGPFLSVHRESLRGPYRTDYLTFVRETKIPISTRTSNAEQ